MLVSRPRGYALQSPPESLDAHRFTYSVDRARTLVQRGHPGEARETVEAGLRLWRGEALADATQYDFAAHAAQCLEQAHQEAQELRIEAMILQGDLRATLQAGVALSGSHPLLGR